jgi:uncharacterized protein (TIGR00251 family)
VLLVHVRPGAKVTALLGLHGGRLKIAIAAPPVDGAANEALLEFLARVLRRPRRQLHLHAGAASRSKSVRIETAQLAQVTRALAALLPGSE